VYFLALEKVLLLPNPGESASIYTREMLNLVSAQRNSPVLTPPASPMQHRGQGKEIYWREKKIIPSEGEYLHMVQDKTGGLCACISRVAPPRG